MAPGCAFTPPTRPSAPLCAAFWRPDHAATHPTNPHLFSH
jgi:hypothetical protein